MHAYHIGCVHKCNDIFSHSLNFSKAPVKRARKGSRRERSDQTECSLREQTENQSSSDSDHEPHKNTGRPNKVNRRHQYKKTARRKKVKH